jgi:hypothetical protein
MLLNLLEPKKGKAREKVTPKNASMILDTFSTKIYILATFHSEVKGKTRMREKDRHIDINPRHFPNEELG